MSMPEGDLPARRRDEFSDWHDLVPASCAGCGCTYFLARDDPAIVWDPGRAWGEACSNRSCSCHEQPVIGTQRGLPDHD